MLVIKKWITTGIKASIKKKSTLRLIMIVMVFSLKRIEKYLNQSLKKQKTSIFVRYLTPSVTLSNS